MDESSGTDRHWLDDRIQGVEGEESGFTVVNSPLRPVVERGDPWKVDVRHHELKAFLEPLEPSGDGRSRVAIMTDVEEDPVARVQTAVLLARRLAEQGRKVLLVDADVRHVGLSRWLPDRDLDAEGLVDVLQYGASVSALRRHGPVDGVDVLAVGSYRPDDASLFEEEALLRLVQQLRAEADVVLVLTPGWVTDERFHPFLVHGDAVIVSLHLDRTLGPRLQELLEYLSGLNVPVAGLMTYAGPDAAERHVDDVLDPGAMARDDDAAGRIEAPLPTPPLDETPAPVENETPVDEADIGDAPARPETRPRAIEPADDDDGGSSRVFRFAAVGALLLILAFVGWWGLSSRDDGASVPSAPGRPPVDVVSSDESADDTANTAGAPEELSGAQAAQDTPSEVPVEDDAQTPPPAPEDDRAPASDEVYAWERDLALPPGGGFALHVASFRDAGAAASEVDRLQRDEGWDPIVREATVDGQQWYRVLVGRFAARSDALAARGPVGEIMKTDWIGVIRVP